MKSPPCTRIHPLRCSFAAKKKPELKTCNPGSMKFVTDKEPKQLVEADQEVIFTYDVLFQVRDRCSSHRKDLESG